MPYWIYSNRQDDGTMRGPSNSPVPVANVPSYVARSAVPTGGAGAGGGGRGRGGGGAGGGAGARGGAPAPGAAGAAGAGAARGAAPPPAGTAADTGTLAPPDAGVQPAGGGRGGRGGATSQWQGGIGGCESGFTLPMPRNPDIVWASCYGNEVTRCDARRRTRAIGVAVDAHARLRADQV